MANEPVREFQFDVETDRKLTEAKLGQRGGEMTESGYAPLVNPDDPAYQDRKTADLASPIVEEVEPRDDEATYLKKRLGEQGNEIGELRRQLQDFTALQEKIQNLEGRLSQPQAPQVDFSKIDIFADVPEEEKVAVPNIVRRSNQAIAALLNYMSQAEAVRTTETQYLVERATSGITEKDEQNVLREYPSLRNVAGSERARVIGEIIAARRAADEAPDKKARRDAEETARREHRRSGGYVEPSSPTSHDATSGGMEPVMDNLLRAVRQGKFKTSADMEKALRKVGIGRVDDLGRRIS